MRRRNVAALAIVLLSTAALAAVRQTWLEPRAIGLACLHGTAPALVCDTRTAVGWLVYHYLIGTLALLLGILGLRQGSVTLSVAALCTGIAGLINYNISWGMLGVALGVWGWVGVEEQARPGLCPGPTGARGPGPPLP